MTLTSEGFKKPSLSGRRRKGNGELLKNTSLSSLLTSLPDSSVCVEISFESADSCLTLKCWTLFSSNPRQSNILSMWTLSSLCNVNMPFTRPTISCFKWSTTRLASTIFFSSDSFLSLSSDISNIPCPISFRTWADSFSKSDNLFSRQASFSLWADISDRSSFAFSLQKEAYVLTVLASADFILTSCCRHSFSERHKRNALSIIDKLASRVFRSWRSFSFLSAILDFSFWSSPITICNCFCSFKSCFLSICESPTKSEFSGFSRKDSVLSELTASSKFTSLINNVDPVESLLPSTTSTTRSLSCVLLLRSSVNSLSNKASLEASFACASEDFFSSSVLFFTPSSSSFLNLHSSLDKSTDSFLRVRISWSFLSKSLSSFKMFSLKDFSSKERFAFSFRSFSSLSAVLPVGGRVVLSSFEVRNLSWILQFSDSNNWTFSRKSISDCFTKSTSLCERRRRSSASWTLRLSSLFRDSEYCSLSFNALISSSIALLVFRSKPCTVLYCCSASRSLASNSRIFSPSSRLRVWALVNFFVISLHNSARSLRSYSLTLRIFTCCSFSFTSRSMIFLSKFLFWSSVNFKSPVSFCFADEMSLFSVSSPWSWNILKLSVLFSAIKLSNCFITLLLSSDSDFVYEASFSSFSSNLSSRCLNFNFNFAFCSSRSSKCFLSSDSCPLSCRSFSLSKLVAWTFAWSSSSSSSTRASNSHVSNSFSSTLSCKSIMSVVSNCL